MLRLVVTDTVRFSVFDAVTLRMLQVLLAAVDTQQTRTA